MDGGYRKEIVEGHFRRGYRMGSGGKGISPQHKENKHLVAGYELGAMDFRTKEDILKRYIEREGRIHKFVLQSSPTDEHVS